MNPTPANIDISHLTGPDAKITLDIDVYHSAYGWQAAVYTLKNSQGGAQPVAIQGLTPRVTFAADHIHVTAMMGGVSDQFDIYPDTRKVVQTAAGVTTDWVPQDGYDVFKIG